ncbi:formylglycine-generating enzyme family protein [Thiobaca trueperi]|uniref:Formylglycine-generating enzyme required for sulfatase activity n=1 Tax=Thiobaca trueperi TaxID=127458 RepID=A0A4R3N4Z1_9GAMM|nr:formylglycine-generating enzyme family protein [Thiobaca trueperi]TCT22173.1 formylglycine-generating enzyme required for sulfatase activity [Thiobaca trueperi]
MAEQLDSQFYDEDAETLRKTLDEMRQEAAREVERLNRQLAERHYASDNSVASATERLALHQEMTVLQQTLEAKAQALDQITEECRRLEDELEDHNMALDGLKQEVERKEQALKDAQSELEQLRREMAERQPPSAAISPAAPSRPAPPPAPVRHPVNTALAGLLVLFVVLSLSMGVFLYLIRDRIDFQLAGLRQPAEVPAVVAVQTSTAGATASQTEPVVRTPETASSTVTESEPPRVQNDRLRSGGLGPAMAALAGGVFQMGSNSLSGEDFSPAREVRIDPFLIGVHEVTFRDYDRFARATGRSLPNDFGWGRDTRPVVGVSWDEATAYADWLSRETGRRYRLPSEAEWEFATRAGGTGSYWWGFGMEPGRAVCLDCGSQWDNRSTAPVGSFPPNPFGLYDQAGNAMEWVADCYTAGYRGAPDDGRPRLDGDCATRVARGGAFNRPSVSMRSHVRARFTPQSQFNLLGFRVAREP